MGQAFGNMYPKIVSNSDSNACDCVCSKYRGQPPFQQLYLKCMCANETGDHKFLNLLSGIQDLRSKSWTKYEPSPISSHYQRQANYYEYMYSCIPDWHHKMNCGVRITRQQISLYCIYIQQCCRDQTPAADCLSYTVIAVLHLIYFGIT